MTIRDYKKDALSKGYDDWDFNSYLDETCSNKLDIWYDSMLNLFSFLFILFS